VDTLDAGNGAKPQKLQRAGPIVGRLIAQKQADFAARAGGDLRTASAPQGARRTAEHRLKRLVESAETAEARRKRDLGHRQGRLVNELLGETNTAGVSDPGRRGAPVLV